MIRNLHGGICSYSSTTPRVVGSSTVSPGRCSHLLRALETFRALGIEFVSLSEQVDTSTPMGKMVFTVLGAVAELERSLIVERVKAGLRNARAKGKRLGRPRVSVSPMKIQELRAEGLTLRDIATRCCVSKTTVIRALN
jgi:DNA invertase Pin-like site-specific DNA recombinase